MLEPSFASFEFTMVSSPISPSSMGSSRVERVPTTSALGLGFLVGQLVFGILKEGSYLPKEGTISLPKEEINL